jgi:hypothetical protein
VASSPVRQHHCPNATQLCRSRRPSASPPNAPGYPNKKAPAASFRHVEALAHFIGRPRSRGPTAWRAAVSGPAFSGNAITQMGYMANFVAFFRQIGVATRVHAGASPGAAAGDPEDPLPRGPSTADR